MEDKELDLLRNIVDENQEIVKCLDWSLHQVQSRHPPSLVSSMQRHYATSLDEDLNSAMILFRQAKIRLLESQLALMRYEKENIHE